MSQWGSPCLSSMLSQYSAIGSSQGWSIFTTCRLILGGLINSPSDGLQLPIRLITRPWHEGARGADTMSRGKYGCVRVSMGAHGAQALSSCRCSAGEACGRAPATGAVACRPSKKLRSSMPPAAAATLSACALRLARISMNRGL